MIRMRALGIEKVKVELRNIGEMVVDNARKTMRASAKRIVKEAQLNAPVDDHQLEKAIHVVRDYGDRGRLEINIEVGGVVDGVNVDDYAALMHEGSYNLGPASQQKQAANPGRIIGPKFLTRAAEEEEEKLDSKMIAAIRRVTSR